MEDLLFCGLNLGAWVTIVTVLSMFLTLIFTKLREDIAFLGVIAVLLLTGVLDVKEALGGFSASSVVLVGVLFAVLAGLVHTGVLEWIMRHLLGTPKNYSNAVVRLMLPVAGLSSLLSNSGLMGNFIRLNVDDVRQLVEELPWVQSAAVRKQWPSLLQLHITEKIPQVRWGADRLYSQSVGIFTPPEDRTYPDLVRIRLRRGCCAGVRSPLLGVCPEERPPADPGAGAGGV